MSIRMLNLAASAAMLLMASPVLAQPARAPATRAAGTGAPAVVPAAEAPATVSSLPQQTTASFADWTLRCTRLPAGSRFCEIVQGVQREERPVAEVAIGRTAKGQPLQMTMLVPTSISFGSAPALQSGDTSMVDLAWRRCLPVGCVADGALNDDVLRRLRAGSEALRLVFPDGAGRVVPLPFSVRGLPQALDALGKEEG